MPIYDHYRHAEIARWWKPRAAEIAALAQSYRPDEISRLYVEQRWVELLPVGCLLEHGPDPQQEQTDPAMFKTLARRVAELRAAGLGFLTTAHLLSKIAKQL